MAREDKNGGEESLADHVNCPTHHLSFSAGKHLPPKHWKSPHEHMALRVMLTVGSIRQLTYFHLANNFHKKNVPKSVFSFFFFFF